MTASVGFLWQSVFMPGYGRAERLEALRSLLAQYEVTTAEQLSADLGVSVRTVQRDLSALRARGLPIDGERGRGGGVRLEPGWSLGRVHLDESEALGLLLSLSIAEKINSPLLLGDLRSITRKVASAFAPAQARRIRTLRSRILVGEPASNIVMEAYEMPGAQVTSILLEAFWKCRLVSIRYRDREGNPTERVIEAQCLYYNVPVWYVLAWDHLRSDVRFFRIDRIEHVSALGTQFHLRPARIFISAGEPGARPV